MADYLHLSVCDQAAIAMSFISQSLEQGDGIYPVHLDQAAAHT
jgi:hypothetical protein